MNQSAFSQRLADLMAERKLNGRAVAEAVGVSPTVLSKYKRQGSLPSGDILIRLADALETSPRWLLTGEGSRDNAAAFSDFRRRAARAALELAGDDREHGGQILEAMLDAARPALDHLAQSPQPEPSVLRDESVPYVSTRHVKAQLADIAIARQLADELTSTLDRLQSSIASQS